MIPVLDGGPSPDAARTLLDEALHAAVFTAEDLDQAYADGKEDLAAKLAELIEQSDFEITNHAIMRFVEAEIGYTPDDLEPRLMEYHNLIPLPDEETYD